MVDLIFIELFYNLLFFFLYYCHFLYKMKTSIDMSRQVGTRGGFGWWRPLVQLPPGL